MAPLLRTYITRTVLTASLVYTSGWAAYYIYTDTRRRLYISSRTKEFERKVAATSSSSYLHRKGLRTNGTAAGAEEEEKQNGHDLELGEKDADEGDRWKIGHLSEEDKELLKERWASLKIAGRYVNPFFEWREQGAWEWAFWKLVQSPLEAFFLAPAYPTTEIPQELQEVVQPDWKVLRGPSREGRLNYTWIGQSTSFIQMSELNILTDPVFSDRTLAHHPFYGPQRLRPAPCELSELPPIDVVLVSHNHFDHLDIAAVRELGNSVRWFVPLGVKEWFTEQGVQNVIELDWWQSSSFTLPTSNPGKSFRVTATPAMHWSGRIGIDTNTSLWAGMHLEEVFAPSSPSSTTPPPAPLSLFHAGDTGYSKALFKSIGQVFGPISLAAIPIGSYGPSWHLHLHHTDPEGAIRIALDVGARASYGVHWGTWIMSDEPPTLAPQDVWRAKEEMRLKDEDLLRIVNVGRTVELS
ncbi:beta-lactamase superfamily domain-containing protein [Mrakia frigida]|uniref:beta-lactamase superfamily domain-containing protein n=1 Tax=Mrakia frigida TaxID=29902 RepID=UPI003FCC0667